MGDGDAIVDALAAKENRYILVRPAGGLSTGYEAVNVWNGDVLKRADDKEGVVDFARGYAVESTSFDYVLEVHEVGRVFGGEE